MTKKKFFSLLHTPGAPLGSVQDELDGACVGACVGGRVGGWVTGTTPSEQQRIGFLPIARLPQDFCAAINKLTVFLDLSFAYKLTRDKHSGKITQIPGSCSGVVHDSPVKEYFLMF